MTDSDLNKLFAEKVAGWVPYEAPKNKGSLLLPYKWFDGSGRPQVEIENFTASMDAVAPWMEKFSHHNGEENGGEPIVFRIYSPACSDDVWTVEPVWMHHDGDIPESPIKDKSLPRACVLALLRAKGVAV